jgi:hypothetical protein
LKVPEHVHDLLFIIPSSVFVIFNQFVGFGFLSMLCGFVGVTLSMRSSCTLTVVAGHVSILFRLP